MIGVHKMDDHVAIGFRSHLAPPIFGNEWNEDMTLKESKKLLEVYACVVLLEQIFHQQILGRYLL